MNGRTPRWAKAIAEIEDYWDEVVGKTNPGGQVCIAVSVSALGLLFVLAMPWFVSVSLKRAIIG